MTAPTVTVAQLTRRISQRVAADMAADLWVRGEVSSLRTVRSGAMFLDLTDADGQGQVIATLKVTCPPRQAGRIARQLHAAGVELADGVAVRVGGRLEFYGRAGSLQLALDRIDPTFTAGQLATARTQTLTALTDAGDIGRNQQRPVSRVPLRVALITSAGSDAHHDVARPLDASRWAFDLTVHPATVQGPTATRSVIDALAAATATQPDVIAICRGGGAASTLATFDDHQLCVAVARCPIPVWVGIGHRADHPLVEQVAHTACATPTAVADHLIGAVDAVAAATAATKQRILTATTTQLRDVGQAGRRYATTVATLAGHVTAGQADLARTATRIRTAVGRQLADTGRRTASHHTDTVTAAARQLATADRRLDRPAAITAAADPTARLAAGWALLLDRSGRPLGARPPAIGEDLTVTTAAGTFTVTVTSPASPTGQPPTRRTP